MPIRYGNTYRAFGWLAATSLYAALFVGEALGQIKNDVPGESPKHPAEAVTQQEDPPASPVIPPEPAEPIASPKIYEPDCDHPKSREDADLCAQRRMANAAEDTIEWVRKSVEWAENQFYASIGEIVALVVTIGIATIAVCAAFGANRIARKSAERQLRAYVFIKDARRTRRGDTDPWVLEIHVKNFGQTPAYRARFRYEVKIMNRADVSTFEFPLPDKDTVQFDFAPGHEQTIRPEIPELTGEVWDSFKAKQMAIYMWGRVDFIDAFGESRWMRFRLFQTGGYILNLFTCPEGNETSESQKL